ncbi:Uncharacterised protein [Mycobacteroides abscessus subsp. abscessus]|nr:Uncharacterised protein [Mycobacteroides abscessus subsp. abscessus]
MAFSIMLAITNGQLISNAALPCSNAKRAVPSSVCVIEGSAPSAVAIDFMVRKAVTVACRCAGVSVNVTVLPSPARTEPPALDSSVLNRTTRPSYCLPCRAIQLGPSDRAKFSASRTV